MGQGTRVIGLGLLLGGFSAGALLATALCENWGPELGSFIGSTNFATLIAGLGGGALGGLISYVTARQTSSQTIRRDREAQIAAENASALTVIIATTQISNRIYTLQNRLHPAYKPQNGVRPWQLLKASPVQEMHGISYQASDFIPFIKAKTGSIPHRCIMILERYYSIEASWKAYCQMRIQLQDFLVPHSTIVNGFMQTELPQSAKVHAHYLMDCLDDLIAQMHIFATEDLETSKKLLTDMNTSYKKYFGTDAIYKVAFVEENAA